MSRLRATAIVAVVTYWVLFYFAYFQAVQPWGVRWLFESMSATFMLMPFVLAVPLVLGGVGIVKRQAGDALLSVGLVLICVGAFWGFHRVNWFVRSRAVSRVVISAAGLTDAVRSYSVARGEPPPNLEALVPAFIPKIPSTGMGAYPAFEYKVGSEAPAGEAWALTVPTSLGILNWDILLYLPSGQYPTNGFGGRLERFGDWAYVHE